MVRRSTRGGLKGAKCHYIISRRWFQIFFMFTPNVGEDEPSLTNIFQRGWFNHRLDIIEYHDHIRLYYDSCYYYYDIWLIYTTIKH